jgi:cell division protein ZapA (FtsZ GTPase activity inhibitor)
MPEIEVDLCGHHTTVACGAEDEARLRHLITQVGARADAARSIVGDNDRWRQLLFAAIFLADELDSATPAAATDENDAARSRELIRRIGAALDRIETAVAGVEPQQANA